MLHSQKQESLTCAERNALTVGIDGLLASLPSLLKLTVLAARTVYVTVETSGYQLLEPRLRRGWALPLPSVADLHLAVGLNWQSEVQQGSSLRWSSPGSHCSPSSTREFPQTLLFLTLKHEGALERSVFPTEILLQLEKRCITVRVKKKGKHQN